MKRKKRRRVARGEVARKEKRNKIVGLVQWVASNIVLAVATIGASVWKYFRKFDTTKLGQSAEICGQLRVCLICLEEAKTDPTISFTVEVDGGNTTKMTNHLLKCHKSTLAERREQKAVESVARGNSLHSFLNNGSIFLGTYLRWVVMTYQPIATCEDPYFRDMCKSLNVNYKNIGRAKVTEHLKNVSEFVKQSLILALAGNHVAITCDHWTSVANVSYLAATVHFINEDWELVSFTLSCKEHSGSTTAPDVLREVKKAWEAFGITEKSLVAIVTDTAPVMTLFGKLLDEQCGVAHVYCTAHVLELTTG